MTFPTHDTNWATSGKGNKWRRQGGKILVVGRFKTNDYFWAMRDGEFLKGKFSTIQQAQHAVESASEHVPEDRFDLYEGE
jgi:hypothetical protein